MSKLVVVLACLAVSLSSVACSSSTTSSSSGGSSSTPGSHNGSYSGSYTGDASGPVTMTVSGSDLDVVATVAGKQYPGSGTIAADGSTSVGIGTGNGVTVTFQGTFAGGKGSGSWQSSVGTKGTWSVAR